MQKKKKKKILFAPLFFNSPDPFRRPNIHLLIKEQKYFENEKKKVTEKFPLTKYVQHFFFDMNLGQK